MNENLNTALNQQLANMNVLYTKLHNYHWYVKGEHFFTLHEKFEELYNEVTGYSDEIAENMLASGAVPAASLREYLTLASIEEAANGLSANEMVQSVVDDFSKIGSEIRKAIEIADEENDIRVADLLEGIVMSLEKHQWMLNAYLGK
ncbi:Dps family protein [Chengkuizengella axinellae]|uniref:DNA starvation/stationary phase protection protein n=1 Tax=Chengkuizengella axinellae TaxID=3064388 RepID=A0ABT9J4G0_9BACL|nr:DNA starvation/stationary phase protection protein [Chengkuizengella sp. 2205SS18-9]MDP5276520.1 DNA starvation/stationary phase protection protein [Chengkuizengella sp. 2205SS18-9]